MRDWMLVAAALLLLAPLQAIAADGRVKLAVLDFQPRGVDPALASNATSLAASELSKLDVFRVISREDIRTMMSFEKDRQKLGCEADTSCLAEIGGALGVEYMVSGSLAQIGDTLLLNLALNNVKRASVENRITDTIKGGRGELLIAAVSRGVKALVSPVLKGRQGFLVLRVREAGALIKIDGQIRGTSPMRARLPVSWGPHLLEVEKTGFVAYSEDISISNKQTLQREVELEPSSDFLEGYQRSAQKMRTGAWISTGVAVAAVATAVVFNQLSGKTEDQLRQKRDAYAQNSDPALLSEMNSLSSRGSTQVLLARVGLGAGVAAAALASYFWIAGDDPHRYDSFKETGGEGRHAAAPGRPAVLANLQAAAIVLPSGGQMGLSVHF